MTQRIFALLLLAVVWVAPAAAADPEYLLSYEAVPSAQLDLPHIDEAGYAERAALTERVLRDLMPDVMRAVGIDPERTRTLLTPGGYLLRTNASLQTRLAGTPDDAARLAAALGYVFRQYSVMVSDLGTADGGTGYVAVSFAPGRLDAGLAQRFFEAAAALDDGLGGGYTAFGDTLYFLNVRGDDGAPYSGLDDATFARLLGKAAAGFAGEGASVVEVGRADARFVGNDWVERPGGEGYAALLGGPRGDAVTALDRLRDRHTAIVLDAAQHYGWR